MSAECDLGKKSLDVLRFIAADHSKWGAWQEEYDALCARYSQKAVERKLEALARKGLIDYGVSARTGWLTDKGRKCLP